MSAFDTAPILTGRRTRSTPLMVGALILFLVALIGTLTYSEVMGRAVYNNTQHAEDMLLVERDINNTLLDMETGIRGYIITGNGQFLEPYETAAGLLPALWVTMTEQIQMLGGPGTEKREQLLQEAEAWRASAEQWHTEWAIIQVENRRQGEIEEAATTVTTVRGKELFDAFRARGDAFSSSLTEQLRLYNDLLNSIRTSELVVIAVLGLLTVGCAILIIRTAQRERKFEMEATYRIETERRQLQAVVDNLPIAVRVLDIPDSNAILQNALAEEIFPSATWNRLSRAERIEYFDLRHPDGERITVDTAPVARGIREGRTVRDVEIITSSREAGTRRLMVSAAPIKDRKGNVTSSVVVLQDVTSMKAIDERKDEFIAIAAHELRNPLAALVGYNYLAQRTLAKARAGASDALPTIERHLGEMSKQIERLTKLIRRLLDASRIQLGRLNIERATVDIVKMANEAVINAETTDDGAHTIELSAPPALEVAADAVRVEQVITNLLDNAIKYAPGGTNVQITISSNESEALVEIKDQGPGIPEEQRPNLFNRYYGPIPSTQPDGSGMKAAPTASGGGEGEAPAQPPKKKRGLGLGLYVSAEIVHAHGGDIGVRPNPDGGSTFWFTLPVAGSQEPADGDA